MMRLKLAACLLSLAIATLTGCTLDPHYERPAAPVAATFPQGDGYESTTAAQKTAADTSKPLAVDTQWRTFFRDPLLQRLIQIALDNNRDLRVAALNVAEYEAQYRITRAALGPSISASGGVTRERTLGLTSVSNDLNIGTTRSEERRVGKECR